MKFGETIRQLRAEADLTQQQLAEAAGISISYLSMLERGERTPTIDTLAALATAMHLRVDVRFVSAETPETSLEVELLRRRVRAALGEEGPQPTESTQE